MREPKGFFIIARKLFDSFLWQEERSLSKFEAFLYLLHNAQYSKEPQKVLIKNKLLVQERGELLRSQRRLARDWGWGTKTVRSFLNLLKKNETISIKTETVTSRITILNYSKYQSIGVNSEHAPDHTLDTGRPHFGHRATYERIKGNKSNESNERKKTSCSEPKNGSEQEPVFKMLIKSKKEDPKFEFLFQEDIDTWKEAFPEIDIISELKKMNAWSNTNPTRQKTANGIRRFIFSWLRKENDKPKVEKNNYF